MKYLRFLALLLLLAIGTAGLLFRHTFEFVFMTAGALCGLFLWRTFGRRGRRWLLLAVGIPAALTLGVLDALAESLVFSHSFYLSHRAARAVLPVPIWLTGPIWLLGNIFAGWLTNPNPGTESVPAAQQSAI